MFDPWSGNPWLFNPLTAAIDFQKRLHHEAGGLTREELRQRYEMPDSQYLELDGMNVHYRDVGEGPALLLLHGLMSSLHTWNRWTEILSQHFRVISIDLPNFGLTGAHPRGMCRHLYSDFVADFTTALGIQRCAIAGNSMGGWIGWEYTARFPQRVSQLVLLDSAGFSFVPPTFMMGMAMPGGGWVYSRSKIPREQIEQMLTDIYFDPSKISEDDIQRYYDLFMAEGNRTAAARVMRYVRDTLGFETNLLDQIKTPVLLQWGANDPWMPISHASRFMQQMPQSELKVYEHCGHLVMEEAADRSAMDCRDFLLKHNSGG
ncbi:alpha/beta fold hydrolase [Parathalassolituus penaei]|uniref:Alpha/beta hydrolase n=1 Tax=Parathalassolituus penaei TaxID=2997323 RepID=A0A9X3EGR7_9GAMM|nr:alpha/beta hydrolase [Parathalassolituus penaei]MCY0967257.1 alpha/beta hydrolase [Parathalassolituus penaei]